MSHKDTAIIDLYVFAANAIFQECFARAGLLKHAELERKMWSLKLRDKLWETKEIAPLLTDDEWISYHDYLRDRYNKVMKIIQGGNLKQTVGLQYRKLLPLLAYARVADYQSFNEKFVFEDAITPAIENPGIVPETTKALEPVAIQALYSSKVFGRFDILRNPDNGFINFYANGDFIFEGETSLYLKQQSLINARTHSMYEDKELWVKIDYERNGKIFTAYFAEIESTDGLLKLLPPERLLHCLQNKED